LGDSGADVEKILKFIAIKKHGLFLLDSSGSGQGPVAGSCEHGNEPSGSMNNPKND
jgi:hypothetical protein